jgi:hypothetical protein
LEPYRKKDGARPERLAAEGRSIFLVISGFVLLLLAWKSRTHTPRSAILADKL